MSMDEANALVHALGSSRMHCVSQACSMCQCVNMMVVHGHGRGKRLGTCLVLEPRALCVVNLQHAPMFQYAGCARLIMMVVHGHGRGMRLGTCLVCAACAVAIVVCVTSDELCCPKLLHARKQDACAI